MCQQQGKKAIAKQTSQLHRGNLQYIACIGIVKTRVYSSRTLVTLKVTVYVIAMDSLYLGSTSMKL